VPGSRCILEREELRASPALVIDRRRTLALGLGTQRHVLADKGRFGATTRLLVAIDDFPSPPVLG
jgi:hypothetical protein